MHFFVIEGLDGSGKSTQVKLLREHFEKQGIPHKYLHFPRTDTPVFGELVAKFLRGDLGKLDEVDPYLVALLYAGDRFDASTLINKWLGEGYHVLIDRYVCSNIAYQCAKLLDERAREALRNWIVQMEYGYFKLPQPEKTIFLDVPFVFTAGNLTSDRMGEERAYLQGKHDIHEADIAFQERVRQIYLWIAATEPGFDVLPCFDDQGSMKSPNQVFTRLLHMLNLK